MSELRRKMLADLRIRNYAERTQEIYIACVAQMARELGRSPDELSGKEVREYLRYLKEERGVSRSVLAQVVGALRFLYRETLGRPEMVSHIPYPRVKRQHPVVLSPEEEVRLLKAIRNLKVPDGGDGVLWDGAAAQRGTGARTARHRLTADGDHGSPRQG